VFPACRFVYSQRTAYVGEKKGVTHRSMYRASYGGNCPTL
jgi:hypothetical protein